MDYLSISLLVLGSIITLILLILITQNERVCEVFMAGSAASMALLLGISFGIASIPVMAVGYHLETSENIQKGKVFIKGEMATSPFEVYFHKVEDFFILLTDDPVNIQIRTLQQEIDQIKTHYSVMGVLSYKNEAKVKAIEQKIAKLKSQ